MKYSITVASNAPDGYPAIYKKNIYENIKKAFDFGYTGIEWHLRQPDFREAEKIKNFCDDLKMPITTIGTGMGYVIDGLTLMHIDREVRTHAVERLKEFIDLGEMLGSTIIIGSMKGKIPIIEEYSKYETYLIENLKTVIEYDEQKGVLVVLEVINRYETNLLNTIDKMNEFIENIGSKLLKTHIDTFHMNIEEPDMIKSIENCKNTLGHVHFADSNRWYPGAGHIDFKPIIRTLEKIGYTGYIAIECFPYPEPDTAAKKTIDYLSTIQI